MIRALIVEDEPKLADALREHFEADGYHVTVAHTGDDALSRLQTAPFEVVLLDLTLPGRNGLDVLSMVRQRGLQPPVLVITSHTSIGDRVAGLNCGADDYLVKPFALVEVSARVRALLRRGQPREELPIRLTIGDVHLDRLSRRVTRSGEVVALTVREFELLDYLAQHLDRIVSREMLARNVWHDSMRTMSLDNVIDVHVARLRRKLDLNRPVSLIHTVRGVGFVLRESEP